MAELQSATTGPEFARLLWLVEDLIYTDLLKGTGWGRKRVWFREQLEACNTVAQVGRCAIPYWLTRASSWPGTFIFCWNPI